MSAEIQAKPRGFLNRELFQLAPARRHEGERRIIQRRLGAADDELLRARETGAGEGFEIRGNALLGNIAVHPHPESEGPGGARRMVKAGFELGGGNRIGRAQRGGDDHSKEKCDAEIHFHA